MCRTLWLGALASFSLFLAILAYVRTNHHMEADVVTTLKLQENRRPGLDRIMSTISWLGFQPQSLIIPALSISGAFLLERRRDAMFLAVAWFSSLANYTTKRIVQRPRPSGRDGIHVTKANLRDSSFPSGHVMHYMVFWGFVAYLLSRRIPSGRLRQLVVGSFSALIVLVGPSRVYLGHHWTSDVIGSYFFGLSTLLALIGLHQRGPR